MRSINEVILTMASKRDKYGLEHTWRDFAKQNVGGGGGHKGGAGFGSHLGGRDPVYCQQW